ncbi:MAG: hypothetical protein FWC00_04845 [Firmicutes bacterium]|nr:hypothetical protein [Bacillota bacterium]
MRAKSLGDTFTNAPVKTVNPKPIKNTNTTSFISRSFLNTQTRHTNGKPNQTVIRSNGLVAKTTVLLTKNKTTGTNTHQLNLTRPFCNRTKYKNPNIITHTNTTQKNNVNEYLFGDKILNIGSVNQT